MKIELKYQVITSLEARKGYIKYFKPEVFNKTSLTEVTESGASEYEIPNFQHRKYVSYFSTNELKSLLESNWYSTCDTMGALTFRGLEPAISFDFEVYDNYQGEAYMNSYVTPIVVNENELFTAIDKLEDKEIKLERIRTKIDRVLELLRSLDNSEIHLPNSFNIDLEQIELELS